MHYAVIARDKPGLLSLRLAKRDEHRTFLHGDLSGYRVAVVFGGPLLSPDEETPIGTLMVIEASSVDDVKALVADDPYSRASLFDHVEITPWRFAVGRR
ncbi:MAG: YciI family protein [Hyphomicrobiaceae bacterium]|nr:MAG: YciI family protein [Hyphomicrobiaceae bacterium]